MSNKDRSAESKAEDEPASSFLTVHPGSAQSCGQSASWSAQRCPGQNWRAWFPKSSCAPSFPWKWGKLYQALHVESAFVRIPYKHLIILFLWETVDLSRINTEQFYQDTAEGCAASGEGHTKMWQVRTPGRQGFSEAGKLEQPPVQYPVCQREMLKDLDPIIWGWIHSIRQLKQLRSAPGTLLRAMLKQWPRGQLKFAFSCVRPAGVAEHMAALGRANTA